MRRTSALALALCLSACGTEPDTRPETADYIIEAILVPYCGRGGCHSTNTAAHNYIFDTLAGAKAAMMGTGTGRRRGPLVRPGDPNNSELYTILVGNEDVMPPDMPLPDADVELIRRWIVDGAAGLP